jgi:transglutaminase-like putative cysteine protease
VKADDMAIYRIVHTTRYDFDEASGSCLLEARLRARDLPGQVCRFHQMVVTPLAGQRREWTDTFGNPVSAISVPAANRMLEVSAINVVHCVPDRAQPLSLDTSPAWERARPGTDPLTAPALRPFLTETPLTACPPDLAAYARASFPPGRPVLSAVRDLTARLHRDFAYVPGATTVETTAAQAARLGQGVCQDFAHLGIACLRALGLAARYVSGYLDTSMSKGYSAPLGSAASHAWFAVHAPGLGWVGFDPTNDRAAAVGYVTLAWGRDYRDAAPLRGMAAGRGRHGLQVSVSMTRDDMVLAEAEA